MIDQDANRITQNRGSTPGRNPIWIGVAVAFAFIVLAFGGSYWVSHRMNETADEHAASAGRPGDQMPNLNEQPAGSARGASTTGARPDSSVPPAK